MTEWALVCLAVFAAVVTMPSVRDQIGAVRQTSIDRTICQALVENTPGATLNSYPVCKPFIVKMNSNQY